MRNTILIAYGNPSRKDDGVAFHVLLKLRELLHLDPLPLLELTDGELVPGLQAVYTQQLVPEMSETLAEMDTVVFLDAHVAGTNWPPIYWQEITPMFQTGMVSHHFKPDTLLAWSVSLYGKAPQAFILSVLGSNFDFGYDLSPETALLVDKAVHVLTSKVNLPV